MDEVTMEMKGKNWNGGREVGEEKDSFVDSARFTKWRGTRYTYIYIYIYTKEEKGKSWGVEANDINYSQSPGLKYPKNSRICSWTEAALVGPEYQVPLFKQGILPISPSPSPLTDPSSRSFHSFPLPFFFFFLFLLSSLSLIALFEISTPLICAHDGWKRRGRKVKGGKRGRANPCDYFSSVIEENKSRFLMSVDAFIIFLSLFLSLAGLIVSDRSIDIGREICLAQ